MSPLKGRAGGRTTPLSSRNGTLLVPVFRADVLTVDDVIISRPIMDKWLFADMIDFMTKMPTEIVTGGIVMAIVGIFQVALADQKYGLTGDAISRQVLPFISPLMVHPALDSRQFGKMAGLVERMVAAVKTELSAALKKKEAMTSSVASTTNIAATGLGTTSSHSMSQEVNKDTRVFDVGAAAARAAAADEIAKKKETEKLNSSPGGGGVFGSVFGGSGGSGGGGGGGGGDGVFGSMQPMVNPSNSAGGLGSLPAAGGAGVFGSVPSSSGSGGGGSSNLNSSPGVFGSVFGSSGGGGGSGGGSGGGGDGVFGLLQPMQPSPSNSAGPLGSLPAAGGGGVFGSVFGSSSSGSSGGGSGGASVFETATPSSSVFGSFPAPPSASTMVQPVASAVGILQPNMGMLQPTQSQSQSQPQPQTQPQTQTQTQTGDLLGGLFTSGQSLI